MSMREMGFSESQEMGKNNTAGYQEMMNQAFVQAFMNLLNGLVEDINEVKASELPKIKAAYAKVFEDMGMSVKQASALASEYHKKIENTVKAGVKTSVNDLGFYGGRTVNEALVNKIITISDKQAKSNQLARTVRDEFKKDVVRQADSKGLKTVAEKIQYFLENWKQDQDSNQPKNRKRFIDDLLDGLAKNKGIMGVVSDAFKLITLLGASWLKKFGAIGSIMAAALVLAGPTIAKFLVQGLLKAIPAMASLLGKTLVKVGFGGAMTLAGFAGSGIAAYSNFKEGDTTGGVAHTAAAISYALAPFLGPYAPLALLIGAGFNVIGAYHEKIGNWISEHFPKIAQGFETLRSWCEKIFQYLSKDFIEDYNKGKKTSYWGDKLSKDATWGERIGYYLDKSDELSDKLLVRFRPFGDDKAKKRLEIRGKDREFYHSEDYKNLKSTVDAQQKGYVPKDSPLEFNKYGYVSNFSKLNRNTAWDAMMNWQKSNPEEFNKRYEIIDANKVYTDPKGRKWKGSDLVGYGSFVGDLSNKKGDKDPTQIIMGKGFLENFMKDAVGYEEKTGHRVLGVGKITSGIGTASASHTTGGKAGQHDSPYGYTYDIGNFAYLNDFVNFYTGKYKATGTKAHGDSNGGLYGYHGHMATPQEIITSKMTSDFLITKLETKKEEAAPAAKTEEPKVETQQQENLLPPLPTSPPSPPSTSSPQLPDFSGNRSYSFFQTGAVNDANVGAADFTRGIF